MLKIMIAASIMVYFTLLIILVLNLEEKSKVIKYSFLSFLVALLIVFFFTNELVMDYLLSIIIRFLYFPSFSTIIAVLFVTMVLFIYYVFNDKIKDKRRIINYVYASFIFIGYIIFMLLEVNINSYNSLYEGNSLICLRYITRTFTLWMVTILTIKYCDLFRRKKL